MMGEEAAITDDQEENEMVMAAVLDAQAEIDGCPSMKEQRKAGWPIKTVIE